MDGAVGAARGGVEGAQDVRAPMDPIGEPSRVGGRSTAWGRPPPGAGSARPGAGVRRNCAQAITAAVAVTTKPAAPMTGSRSMARS
ncbi:hypothetical protein BJF79_13295 [Actinomadura sp. CNU-125]|nr:hypothetical protein BJF79_13295 [Actinomadura sp. CNU-125]